MSRRRASFEGDEYMPDMLGVATTLPGRPPRKKKEPIGFCIDPEAYRPKQRKRRKRGCKETH